MSSVKIVNIYLFCKYLDCLPQLNFSKVLHLERNPDGIHTLCSCMYVEMVM